MVLNHELDEFEQNEYQIPTAYQYLVRNGITDLQKSTISLLQKLSKTISQKEQLNLWETYCQELEAMPGSVGHMELLIWAESKRSGKSIEEVYKSKLRIPEGYA